MGTNSPGGSMRTTLSTARHTFRIACAGAMFGLAALVPVATAAAPPAAAALTPVVGCGFHFGPIDQQGAAGTLFYSVALEPANPAQRCTRSVTFTTTAAHGVPATRYIHIDNNPLTATQTVSFAPGRLPPVLTISWGGLHCSDPVVPGAITFASGGQSTSVALSPSTCDGMGNSNFASFPLPPTPSAVGIARTPGNLGYQIVNEAGALTHEGNATAFTAAAAQFPVVGMAPAPNGQGAWVVASDGGVFSYGAAGFHGSLGATHLNAPVVGIAPTPSGLGYWLVASDGGVFSFGDATFHGSLGAMHLNAPISGMAATPDGHGYFLTAADGGVFAFGTAHFVGSLGNVALNAPIVGMAAGAHGGYWLVGSDGSVFAFGVLFAGSLGGMHLNAPVSAMATTSTGHGYWLLGSDGGIFTFGDAHFFGASPIFFP